MCHRSVAGLRPPQLTEQPAGRMRVSALAVAPDHLREGRLLVFEDLTGDELAALDRVATKVLTRLSRRLG